MDSQITKRKRTGNSARVVRAADSLKAASKKTRKLDRVFSSGSDVTRGLNAISLNGTRRSPLTTLSIAGPTTAAVPSTAAAPVLRSDATPRYEGKFDLFSTSDLPLLVERFTSIGAQPRYQTLHHAIHSKQMDDDFTARLALYDDGRRSEFECSSFKDPSEDRPLDVEISVASKRWPTQVVFSPEEAASPDRQGSVQDGFVCDLEMGASKTAGIEGGKGSMKMRRVWVSLDASHELFEGYVEMTFDHGQSLIGKQLGPGARYNLSFWAVRALKDENGEEIGIGEGDQKYVSVEGRWRRM